jgi:hypothetical protein
MYDSDFGTQGGDGISNGMVVMTDCLAAGCGSGNYGYTHNLYVSSVGTFNTTRLRSFRKFLYGTHNLKTRSYRGTHTSSVVIDGEGGGVGCQVEAPNGGVLVISGGVIQRGPNTNINNNPHQLIQYGGDYIANGGLRKDSSVDLNGTTFVNCCMPGGALGDTIFALATWVGKNVITAKTIPFTYENCSFWNIAVANRMNAVNLGTWFSGPSNTTFTDNGGNTTITSFP